MSGRLFIFIFLAQLLVHVKSFLQDDFHSDFELNKNRYLKSMEYNENYDDSLPFSNLKINFFSEVNRSETSDRRKLLDTHISPLYPGYGTHFSYIYVGTPPQRQSVIIDTGIYIIL